MTKVTIDLAKIDAAATAAFKDSCFILGRSFTEAISDPIWNYPRETKRKNKAIAGSPRDIIDTGNLKNSQQPPEFISDTEAKFVWNADYAIFVLMGVTFRNGTEIPGRDWIKEGLRRSNLEKTFALLLKSKLL